VTGAVYEVTTVEGPARQQVMDRLSELHSLDGGRVFVGLRGECRRLDNLAEDVLVALGKDLSYRGVARNQHRKWDLAKAWLLGEGITDVFVSPFDELDVAVHRHLFALPAELGVTLWLVRKTPLAPEGAPLDGRSRILVNKAIRARHAATVEEYGARAFLDRWADVPKAPPVPAPAVFPEPPDEGFVVFLYRAFMELERSDFEQVRNAWRYGLEETRHWLNRSGASVDEVELASFLQDLTSTCGGAREATCVLRGVQVALFLDAWILLKLELERFGRYATLASAADLEAGGADLLRGFISPARAATAVIRAVTHASAEAIVDTRIGDVAADGSRVQLSSTSYTVPARARGIVRAQLHHRRMAGGAESEAPFLLWEDASHPREAGVKSVQLWLRDATLQAGVQVALQYVGRSYEESKQWMSRRGLSIQSLRGA
jgi:hypothetical protein